MGVARKFRRQQQREIAHMDGSRIIARLGQKDAQLFDMEILVAQLQNEIARLNVELEGLKNAPANMEAADMAPSQEDNPVAE